MAPRRRAAVPALPHPPYVPAPGRKRPALPIAAALAADQAAGSGFSPTLFTLGARAFNGGWFWEAHECWEVLWRREPRGAPRRALLQGLILLAAARVKRAQDRPQGAADLQSRALLRLQEAAAEPVLRRALGLARVLRQARRGVEAPPPLIAWRSPRRSG